MCDVIIAYIGLHHTLLHLLSLFALLALKSYYCIACFSCGRKPSQICASVVIRECSQRIGKSKQGHHQTGGYFSLIKKKARWSSVDNCTFCNHHSSQKQEQQWGGFRGGALGAVASPPHRLG